MENNSFKRIEPQENLPEHVKKETMGSLYSLRLFIDVLDLFVIKAGGVAGRSLSSDAPGAGPSGDQGIPPGNPNDQP